MADTCKNPGCCSVILVEDDALLQVVLAMQLERAAINFCSASNGHQALALIKSHHPKVLILDISMPGLSGFEVVEAIRQDPTLSDLNDMHLIVHTSQALSVQEQQMLSFGRVQFVTKTRGGKELSDIVSQALAS
jgi:CheY-like chemotaxis protein